MIEVKTKNDLNFTPFERFDIPFKEGEDIPDQVEYSKMKTNELIRIGILLLNQF